MKKNRRIYGKNIFLRLLTPKDADQRYLGWLKDKEVTQFLECRWYKYTLKSLRKFVRHANRAKGPRDWLFGIFIKQTGGYIGNIKVGSINTIHKFGEIGLMIGDKKSWGKGYGTEAIRLATDFAFSDLKLNKLITGIYINNIGSYKAFMKAGYREVGKLEKHKLYKGKYIDEIFVEKVNSRRGR
jgi:RimJ/RimL family protein N-acetyltransferase